MNDLERFWAVIPAGGSGTRLWPLSRSRAPKFLHDLTGSGRTLLQETYDRLLPLAAERFVVVTGQAHEPSVAAQLSELGPGAILVEPSARDSMAAIGLAAAIIERHDADAVMGSFAADHVIHDSEGFRDSVRAAVAVAEEGWLVTLGISPTSPSPAFGYIHVGDEIGGHPTARTVRQFVEKPTVQKATDYLAGGDFLWNAGMFVVRPAVLLDLLAQGDPDFAARLRRIAADPLSLEKEWPHLPKVALDHAVAEPAADAGRVATVLTAFDWEDIGDFDALTALVAAGAPGLAVLGDPGLVHALDATGLVVADGRRVISVVGLEDVVVVDTPDALLITTRAHAQRVKQVVADLRERGRDDLT